MVRPEARLRELGMELPGLQPAVGNYLSAKSHGDLVYVSGHGPLRVDNGGLLPGAASREIPIKAALAAVVQG